MGQSLIFAISLLLFSEVKKLGILGIEETNYDNYNNGEYRSARDDTITFLNYLFSEAEAEKFKSQVIS